MKERVQALISRIQCSVMETSFTFRVEDDGRVFLQLVYPTRDSSTGRLGIMRSRKWYLSTHMTDDEIIKTAYAAFEMAVKHELMEGFRVDGKILFNPHTNFEALLSVSEREVFRAAS